MNNEEFTTVISMATLTAETTIPKVVGSIGEADLENYYTKDEADNKYATKEQIKDYPTKEYVDNAVKNVEVDLTGYAKTTDIPTNVSQLNNDKNYITETDLEGKNLATEEYVNGAIANIDIPETDLSNYYTKDEVNTALSNKANRDEIPTIPTKVSAFENDAGYLTEHQSLTNYYTKTEVDTAISNVEVDLSDYYTKPEVDVLVENADKIYVGDTEPTDDSLIWISQSGLNEPVATKNYVSETISSALGAIGVAEQEAF